MGPLLVGRIICLGLQEFGRKNGNGSIGSTWVHRWVHLGPRPLPPFVDPSGPSGRLNSLHSRSVRPLDGEPAHPAGRATKLSRLGIAVEEKDVFTCAMATARFLARQKLGGTAYVIGEGGLVTALHQNGYAVVDRDPDYVGGGECWLLAGGRGSSRILLPLQ
jgi:haloacid dehalogenase-like hydrolase